MRFWALRENNTDLGPDYPLRIAVEKLINASYSTISTAEPKPAAVLAVLDQRLHLTYDQRRRSTRMIEEEQVSKHMRLIYVAPQHGEFVYSGYPSEPFLAEAGAHAISALREHYGRVAVETLAYGVEAVLSTQGDAGELVGRLVLMLAYDYAVESSMSPPPDSPPYPPHFSAGVCVETFFRSLIPNEHIESFLDSKPVNLPPSASGADMQLLQYLDVPLRKAFSNASIRFTHFIQIADDIHVDLACAALCRGAAIICHRAQEGVDLVIPVVLNRDKRMAKEEISAIFVRCKLRNRFPSAALDIDTDSIRFFDSGRLPCIAVIMDLGGGLDEGEYPAGPAGSFREISNTPSEVHPRYTITIRGCSSRVYAPIEPAEEELYEKLLGKNAFSEHPRQRKANLDAVHRLVPLWSSGDASLDWIKSGSDEGAGKKRKREND